eukprot:6491474-Amphidinium_carterae.2
MSRYVCMTWCPRDHDFAAEYTALSRIRGAMNLHLSLVIYDFFSWLLALMTPVSKLTSGKAHVARFCGSLMPSEANSLQRYVLASQRFTSKELAGHGPAATLLLLLPCPPVYVVFAIFGHGVRCFREVAATRLCTQTSFVPPPNAQTPTRVVASSRT